MRPPLVHDLLDGGLHHVGVGDIAADGQRLDAIFVGEHLCGFVDFLLAACHAGDVAALICKGFRHLDGQAGRCAGYEGNLPGEIKVVLHVDSPSFGNNSL